MEKPNYSILLQKKSLISFELALRTRFYRLEQGKARTEHEMGVFILAMAHKYTFYFFSKCFLQLCYIITPFRICVKVGYNR